MRFKRVHSSPKNAKSRLCQSQVRYLYTTNLGSLNFERIDNFSQKKKKSEILEISECILSHEIAIYFERFEFSKN